MAGIISVRMISPVAKRFGNSMVAEIFRFRHLLSEMGPLISPAVMDALARCAASDSTPKATSHQRTSQRQTARLHGSIHARGITCRHPYWLAIYFLAVLIGAS